jgi:hypothetical protein
MDLLTCISAAAAVGEFLDLATGIISELQEGGAWTERTTARHAAIVLAAGKLRTVSREMKTPDFFQRVEDPVKARYERQLTDVSTACRLDAKALLPLLDIMDVNGGHKIMESFIRALTYIGKGRELRKVQAKLRERQLQLSLCLVEMMR